MSFWGVEVKSGKPYTIVPDDFDKGRLHISQATLGLGSSKEKSVVQCNVGNNPGVLLCSLMPRRKETCSLGLIFDEEEEVILSVLGPNSVHLTGYFIPDEANEGDNVPGEELGSSDSEDYSGDSDEDEYEKDFIDDAVDEDDSEEEELVFPSRGRKSSVRIEELEDEPEPPAELANGANKKKKKDKKESEAKKDKKKDEVTLEKKSDTTKKKDEVTLEKKSDATKKKDEVTLEKKSDATQKEEKDGSESDSEDEDGFPLPGKRKKQSNNSGQPAKKQMMEIDGASLSKPSETSEPHATEDTPKDSKDSQSVIEPEDATKDGKKSKKKKKKKSKNKESENNAEAVTEEDPKASADLIRTFGNGMIVETLSLGKPDGKKAVGGKKVSMYYVGRLKSGKIFDSKTSGKPFQFRLGVGEVIPGWDVGVEGMRVGDKRRLTVPPAMGYGPKGSPPVIPGNAWLIFEVELIDVK